MKQVELICSGCGKVFLKDKKEYDRQARNGKSSFYCTRQCFGIYVAPKNLQTDTAVAYRNSETYKDWLRRNAERQINSADPFRVYLKLMKNHREWTGEISLDYLKELWNIQFGRCAYSGLTMDHPTWTATNPFRTASIDRIDSSKGYVPGNVQFIIRALNWAKNTANDGEFRCFLSEISMSMLGLTSEIELTK